MKPPNHRADMELSQADMDFMAAQDRGTQRVGEILGGMHLQARLGRLQKETRAFEAALRAAGHDETASYINIANLCALDAQECLEEEEAPKGATE